MPEPIDVSVALQYVPGNGSGSGQAYFAIDADDESTSPHHTHNLRVATFSCDQSACTSATAVLWPTDKGATHSDGGALAQTVRRIDQSGTHLHGRMLASGRARPPAAHHAISGVR